MKLSSADKFGADLTAIGLTAIFSFVVYIFYSFGYIGYHTKYEVGMRTPYVYRVSVWVWKNGEIVYSEYPYDPQNPIRNVDSFKVECEKRISVAIRNLEKQ